jgi:hypothetical protein
MLQADRQGCGVPLALMSCFGHFSSMKIANSSGIMSLQIDDNEAWH